MPKESVLVIDDEEDILELVRYNLNRECYDVACVETGEDGLKAARARTPQLILLDLMLPGLDGLEVCKLLKKDARTRQTPVVLVTSRNQESDRAWGLRQGADHYLPKPFTPDDLLAAVKRFAG